MELRFVEVSRIVEDPEQPRRGMDETALAGLADSIRQHGLLNPITVLPLAGVDGYRIVTGERRWRASQIAGLFEIPCLVKEAPPEDDADKATEQLIENLQREELAPLDRATAIRRIKQSIGATNREVGQRLGISERTVGYLLDLLDLPEAIGEKIVSSPNRPADGNLTEKHARALRQLNDQPDLQAHLVEKIRDEKLSSDDTAKITRALRQNPERQDAILESAIEDLPGVLGRGEDAAPFSTGRAFAQMLERIPAIVAEVNVSAISASDLPPVEQALEKAKSAVDELLAAVRAAQRAA